jgi:molybdopterin-guanine dinucleotide biosynthesis protein A
MTLPTFDAVVLAGGEARRLGGVDKPALLVGEVSLLERVLGACVGAGAETVTVVGPERPTELDVVWTREVPVGGGPVPALAAGLVPGTAPLVALLAADLPFVNASAIETLLTSLQDADAVVYIDATGKDQPLLGVYRRDSLVTALGTVAEHSGARLWAVLGTLTIARIPDPHGVTVDCDTWERVEAARKLLATSPSTGEDGRHGRSS